jgi:hypothetical protein
LIGIPSKIKVHRSGCADAPLNATDELETEMVLDGGWRAASHIPPDAVEQVAGISIADLPEIPGDAGPGPVQWIDVWADREVEEKVSGVEGT